MITADEALARYLAERGIIEPGEAREDWYTRTWFTTEIRGRRLPIFPMVGFRSGLAQHDLHHLLTGYETSFVGECEVAAWEIASGGCGALPVFWLDRLSFLAIGLLAAPRRTLRAFRRGLGGRNLYRRDVEETLSQPLADVERYTRTTAPPRRAPDPEVGGSPTRGG